MPRLRQKRQESSGREYLCRFKDTDSNHMCPELQRAGLSHRVCIDVRDGFDVEEALMQDVFICLVRFPVIWDRV